MSLTFVKYRDADHQVWDQFVGSSENGTFLHLRDYMEYHADRFIDHSLLGYDEKERLRFVLPAHEQETTLNSHGGLTFGGLLYPPGTGMISICEAYEKLLAYARESSFKSVVVTPVPLHYHQGVGNAEDRILSAFDAVVDKHFSYAVVDQVAAPKFKERRRRGVKKATKLGLTVEELSTIDGYWALLEETLQKRFGSKPVHSLEEITSLQSALPSHIRCFGVLKEGALLGGTLIYETSNVAKAQYIATNEEGRNACALDLLFDKLIHEIYRDKRFFDLGTSDGEGRLDVNEGLLTQKEEFGARIVHSSRYRLQLI